MDCDNVSPFGLRHSHTHYVHGLASSESCLPAMLRSNTFDTFWKNAIFFDELITNQLSKSSNITLQLRLHAKLASSTIYCNSHFEWNTYLDEKMWPMLYPGRIVAEPHHSIFCSTALLTIGCRAANRSKNHRFAPQ